VSRVHTLFIAAAAKRSVSERRSGSSLAVDSDKIFVSDQPAEADQWVQVLTPARLQRATQL